MSSAFMTKSGVMAMVLTLVVCAATHALPGNPITDSRFLSSPGLESVQVAMKGRPDYTVFELSNPDRIVVNIRNAFLPDVHLSRETAGQVVRRYRISQNTKERARLVIDHKKARKYRARVISLGRGRYALRVDLLKQTLVAASEPVAGLISPIQPILIAQALPAGEWPARPFQKTGTAEQARAQNQAVQSQSSGDNSGFAMMETDIADDIFGDSETPELEQETSPWKISGATRFRGSWDLSDNQANENRNSLKNRTLLAVSHSSRFKISGLSDYLFFGPEDETDDHDIDLHEAYFRFQSPRVDFTVGKQIKRWGKTDQISPIDTLNPENTTEFFIPAYQERKIPVWMADLTLKADSFFVQGIFLPFFEPARVDYFGTDWAIFSHLKSDISDATALTAPLKAYFNGIGVNETMPDDSDEFEYALRVGGTFRDIDLGLTYHYTHTDLPNLDSFPVKNLNLKNPNALQDLIASMGTLTLTNEQIQVSYPTTHVFGLAFETTVQSIGLRGEAAFKENESFLTSAFTSVRNPSLLWVLGMDYTSRNQWYFNLQIGHQHISDYTDDILFFKEDNVSVIGEINKDIISDWLNTSVQYTYMITDNSFYITPRVIYTYFDNFEVILGLNLFDGDDDTIFGRYDKNDQFFTTLTYEF